MAQKTSLSAIITGPPLGFERPKPQAGETLAHLVIRHFPEQWRDFLSEMESDIAVPPSTIGALQAGNFDAADLTIRRKIEDFITNRLPGHVRTIRALVELQSQLGQAIGGFDLTQILWPSERRRTGETAGQAYAKTRGVEVILLQAEPLDLIEVLPFVTGQFAWLVPIGSRLEPFAAAIQINRALKRLATDLALGMYYDGLYSSIYRLSALTHLAENDLKFSPNAGQNAQSLEMAGYRVFTAEPGVALCHLEPQYGGKAESGRRNGGSVPAARRWWHGLFDKSTSSSDESHQQGQR